MRPPARASIADEEPINCPGPEAGIERLPGRLCRREDPARRGQGGLEVDARHYDRASNWGLDVCDRPLDDPGAYPGTMARLSFPEALERMLNENGYKVGK